jgi:hypothetical protein
MKSFDPYEYVRRSLDLYENMMMRAVIAQGQK